MGRGGPRRSGSKDLKKPAASGGARKPRARSDTYQRSLAEIYQRYDQKIEELSLIRRVGEVIRDPLDLYALSRVVLEAVAREIETDGMLLLLTEPDGPGLDIRAWYDGRRDEVRGSEDETPRWAGPVPEPVARAVASGHPVLIPQTRPGPDFSPPPAPGLDPDEEVSLLVLPLVARGRSVGGLTLWRSAESPFSVEDLGLLTIIADQAATALRNARLVADLRSTNQRLRESENEARKTSLYLEQLFEAANDIIFTLDSSGRISYVNRRVEAWGYRKDDLVGWPAGLLAAEPDSFLSRPGELVENQGGLTELLLLTADGRKREVLLNASRVAGTDPGAHPTYLVLARDVTEYKTMERQLFHSEKLASLGMLAAGVAHEVNNPLSTISGYAQLLSSGPTSPQDTQEYLNAILEQADRIQKIVDALRDYSRPAAGYRTRVRMAETLPRTLAMFTHQKTFGRLKVEYDLDSQAEPVIMDPDHLAQVVVNVAVNAAQAMPKGGRLRVSLRMEGDEVVLRLADNGPGVPPEIRAKIFDPFFTTKPAGRGTGLGLAICQRILEQYGGSLGLEESSSPGATFVLRLPAAPPVPGE